MNVKQPGPFRYGLNHIGLARAMVDVAVWRAGESRALVFQDRDIRAMVESLPNGRRGV